MGRPSKYKPEYCEGIVEFFNIKPYEYKMVVTGMIDEKEIKVNKKVVNDLRFLSQYARKIGVTHDTMLEWCKVHEEFSEAYKNAKELQKEHLITNGLRGNFQTAFAIFTAKNITDMRNDEAPIEINTKISILTIARKVDGNSHKGRDQVIKALSEES